MARNAAKANARASLDQLAKQEVAAWEKAKAKDQRIAEIKAMLAQAEKEYADALSAAKAIHDEIEQAQAIPIDADESTAEIERKLAELKETTASQSQRRQTKGHRRCRECTSGYNVLTAKLRKSEQAQEAAGIG